MIFYDFETSGLSPGDADLANRLRRVWSANPRAALLGDLELAGRQACGNQIIQVAAVVIDEDWQEIEHLERKLTFDPRRADPEALAMNSYDEETWKRDAVSQEDARGDFEDLLRRHKTLTLMSRRNRPYQVAELAGHNVSRFDQGFLEAWFGEIFIPASFQQLDTLSLAAWWRRVVPGPKPADLKLGTLAAHFGLEHHDAHDALGDVRVNVQVARALLEEMKGL